MIGAGAAGLMAAVAASDAGADVTVYEKNEKAGKKIYITGKGRCNFTNACDVQDFFDNVVVNPKFLYSAIYDFDQAAMIQFLEDNGCPTKVERGKRAFPLSDHASDVTRALTDHLRGNRVKIHYNRGVKKILAKALSDDELAADPKSCATGKISGLLLDDGRRVATDAVILATGGVSYPSTGSTGDGYRFAESLGMEVKPQAPSLVPFTVRETWPLELQGVSLKNVQVTLFPAGETAKKKIRPVYEGFGEMMFTHFGITGPLILSASSYADFVKFPEGFLLHLDLKPALSQEQLAERIAREFDAAKLKEFVHAIRPLFPERLAGVVAQLFVAREESASDQGNGIHRKAYTFNEKEIADLAALIKDLVLTVTGTRGFNEAIITRGGIAVKEINPSTMGARRVKNLYIAGEVIDVNAQTGGFNLQIAWSTGHLAGISAAEGTV